MLLGFKTELKVNHKQRSVLAQHAGTARHAWNWGLALTKQILDHNKANPDNKIKFPTAIDLHKWLVALVKPSNSWYYQSSKCAPQWALRYLSRSWKQAFKKIARPPRFKKKGKSDSFTLDGTIKVEHQKIKIPKIGWLKTYERLAFSYQPKSVTISKKADRWFISFKIEIEPYTNYLSEVVGVDLGIKTLATLSSGVTFKGAKSYRRYEAKLSKLQYLNRHKEKGSSNWKKAQKKIAKIHLMIANIRSDTLHKLTTYLAKNHSQVVIEDLNVSGMLANRKLAKAIQDMGFYEFRRQLEYKCQLYGSELIIADRWFASSKTCSHCGCKKEQLSLSQRVFSCESCGVEIERDLNAAINLKSLAASFVVSACGVVSADTAGSEARK
ncbi:MAG: transposase [Microcoleaceae cyanobacterium]